MSRYGAPLELELMITACTVLEKILMIRVAISLPTSVVSVGSPKGNMGL